jgi:hypothetical protein
VEFANEKRRAGAWATFATAVAVLPFLAAAGGRGVFYVRDLSQTFWGRYLWLRRSWLSGEWPLWDPYVGGGQSAYADALNQIFLLPAVAVRLIGGEVSGFNLWVAMPFPLAALGAFAFLKRRFSPAGSALGAIAFALCGPVVSSGNFPNLSWSVAALPWVLWATDSLIAAPTPRRVGGLAIVVAMQTLAGEPLTLFATLLLALAYAFALGVPVGPPSTLRQRVRTVGTVCAGTGIGVALAAIQLIPMAQAARAAQRAEVVSQDLWSLRPTALLEVVWFHLFGNYFDAQYTTHAPWMPLLFTGREPFFFSLYFGVPALALAAFGLAGDGPRRWRLFWVTAGLAGLVASFGAYTPAYAAFRDHVPLFGSFRFPVKYIVVASMALAAGVACGWDALAGRQPAPAAGRRYARAKASAVGFCLVVGSAAALAGIACWVAAASVAPVFEGFALALGAETGRPAAEFMVRTLPAGAVPVVLLSMASAALIWTAATGRSKAMWARRAIFLLLVGDVVVRAWGINPTFDSSYLAEPAWVSRTKSTADARIYVGGKHAGTLDSGDFDASRAFVGPPGLPASAGRAALNNQAAFYPSAWRVREMISFDLAVLWPRRYAATSERFRNSDRESRARFLDRTGVRYRVLPARRAAGRAPVMRIPYFLESFLFDWGTNIAPRVSVVPDARVVSDVDQQVDAMFQPGLDVRTTVMVERESLPAGIVGPPEPPSARLVEDRSNRVVVEAAAGASGGYLVLLDSYSPDWRVRVDGDRAELLQANGLFRAVRLSPGRHVVEFTYRPSELAWGAAVSAAALAMLLACLLWPPGRRVSGTAGL